MDLGELKIEYKQDGNLVQVFNSPNICSLVINGNVVDYFEGLIAPPQFILKGIIEQNNNQITVIAKMGLLFMKLYYNDVRVGKKFMGFG